MSQVELQDGTFVDVVVTGSGPAVLLPVKPTPETGPDADRAREWGNDPDAGPRLIEALAPDFTVIAFDYLNHRMAHPAAETLTPDFLTADFLTVADAVGARRFAYYGYSWLALSGLQLAIRTDRLWALAMGGFPPIGGPYEEMLKVTLATHELAAKPSETPPPDATGEVDWDTVPVTLNLGQTRQFVTLYESLRGFDDLAAQPQIGCPRLCFAGSADEIDYSERWGGVKVSIGGPLTSRKAELDEHGWEVRVLDGMDHMRAMQPDAVLPILRPWLLSHRDPA